MYKEQIEYFRGNKQEIENEKKRKHALMSYFPKALGTTDRTKYILVDDDKPQQEGFEIIQKHKGPQTTSIESFVNNKKEVDFEICKKNSTFLNPKKEAAYETKILKSLFDFDNNAAEEKNNPFNTNSHSLGLGTVGGNQPRTTTERNDSLALESMEIENRLDSVLYNDKGHMSVTFRNDVIGIDGFKPFNPSDRTGCKRRCMEMLAHSGCELSGERIDMTVNNDNGRAIAQSADFQKGINAIDNALDKKQTIILNVDYKDGTASSADRAGDHFIIIVGRTIIDGIAYYHFYDPATQFADYGTANTNVLYVKDGFLQGSFIKRNGSVNKYKVTSVRLNK